MTTLYDHCRSLAGRFAGWLRAEGPAAGPAQGVALIVTHKSRLSTGRGLPNLTPKASQPLAPGTIERRQPPSVPGVEVPEPLVSTPKGSQKRYRQPFFDPFGVGITISDTVTPGGATRLAPRSLPGANGCDASGVKLARLGILGDPGLVCNNEGIALGDGCDARRVLSAHRADGSEEPLGPWPVEITNPKIASPGRCLGLGEPGPFGAKRAGMTLVELLVVITIMMILAGFVVPKLQMNGGSRRTREAARMVNVYLGVARNRAVETGRPCGVMFQRISNDPNDPQSTGCATLFQVEVPPLYAGDMDNSRVRVQSGGATLLIEETVPTTTITNTLIHIGDKIQFNGQGPWFEIIGPDLDNDGVLDPPASVGLPQQMVARVDAANANHIPWPTAPPLPSASFQIQRQPTQTMTPPLILPTATVVDLATSGDNSRPARFDTNEGSVIVVFSPNGTVSQCLWTDPTMASPRQSLVPTEPLFFLIGRADQLGVGPSVDRNANEELQTNWQIGGSLWLALNPQTGMANVAENAFCDAWYTDAENDSKFPFTTPADRNAFVNAHISAAIGEARTYAKQSRSLGGR